MKKIFSFLFFLLLAAFNSGCSHSDNNVVSPPEQQSPYYVKAKVDGIQKTWPIVGSANFTAIGATGGDLNIIATSTDISSMDLSINSSNMVSVNPLAYGQVTGVYSDSAMTAFASDYSNFTHSAGNITITEFNRTTHIARGTFTFIGKNDNMTVSKTVTEGEFYVHYSE